MEAIKGKLELILKSNFDNFEVRLFSPVLSKRFLNCYGCLAYTQKPFLFGFSSGGNPTRLYHRLFTFLKYPQVQPTNNQAEQPLRYMVIFRKICFGTRSAQGSLSHSVLPSLLMTAKRQGQHPLTFFETLFTSDTATAQAALYNGRC